MNLSSKYKAGDEIVCVDQGNNSYITVGTKYTVVKVYTDGDVQIVNNKGDQHYYKPKHFELSKKEFELKTFMRVKLRNGQEGIIVPMTEHDQKYREEKFAIILKEGSWAQAYFKATTKGGVYQEYEIVEVYAAPQWTMSSFKQDEKGDLLWKAEDPATTEAKKAVEEAQEQLKKAQEALDNAKKKLDTINK